MKTLSRRAFARGLGAGIIGSGLFARSVTEIIIPNHTALNPVDFFPAERPKNIETGKTLCLSFVNLHTGEKLKNVEFWTAGAFEPQALGAINKLFRDFRNNQIKPIDPNLLIILHKLHKTQHTDQPFQLISGFRSSETNNKLHSEGRGVAKGSFHTKGQASDIMIEGRSTVGVARAARSLKMGGVGCYSNFVHIDTGPIRKWGMI